MDHRFVSVRIDSVRLKITVQNIFLRMQDKSKIASQRLEFHLLNGIERMCAGLGSSLNHFVTNVAGIDELIMLQVFV